MEEEREFLDIYDEVEQFIYDNPKVEKIRVDRWNGGKRHFLTSFDRMALDDLLRELQKIGGGDFSLHFREKGKTKRIFRLAVEPERKKVSSEVEILMSRLSGLEESLKNAKMKEEIPLDKALAVIEKHKKHYEALSRIYDEPDNEPEEEKPGMLDGIFQNLIQDGVKKIFSGNTAPAPSMIPAEGVLSGTENQGENEVLFKLKKLTDKVKTFADQKKNIDDVTAYLKLEFPEFVANIKTTPAEVLPAVVNQMKNAYEFSDSQVKYALLLVDEIRAEE